MYGTAIHAALDRYFHRKINNEELLLGQLLSDYKDAFRNVGFITREQEELRFKQGIDSLSRFFDNDKTDSVKPNKTEEAFEFSVGDVKINGRFDLVYFENNFAEIRDFKTSDVREQKDADRRIKESTQMMIYALAWEKKHGMIPKTTLYFIESGLKGERVFKPKELENIRLAIHQVEQGIREKDFGAKPDIFQCKYCPYRDICPEAI
jgi:DNA helicase-2/ATP-dependent DNA helicase PcrA